MTERIKYPVGLQSFRKLREGGYLYVDKTEFIHTLATTCEYIFLSRPRRFGKSLLMSTLECYFKGEKELFEGLAASELKKDWSVYPVFRFDMSAENYNHIERMNIRLNRCLKQIEQQYDLSSDGESPADRLADLFFQAHARFGKRVVVLIDEYDKPLLDCLHDDNLHNAIKDELRGFYSVLKSCDEHIRFCMITGVTKFGQVSVFSGLNNLKDISLLPEYNALCGISDSEFHHYFENSVRDFAKAKGISESTVWDNFKALYDGYHFAESGEDIYNPFSVLRAFDDKKLSHYWYSTGSSTFLVNLVRQTGFILSDLECERRTADELSDLVKPEKDLVPILYQTGYLTIKGYNPVTAIYTLGFPNREVYKGFWSSLAKDIFIGYGRRSTFDVSKFIEDINNGYPERFMERLKALIADTDSCHESNKEIHFQNMMAVVCKMLGLAVNTEVHSSQGRCDIQILTPMYVYIIKIKVDKSAGNAIKQIYDNGYYRPFGVDSRTIFLIGASFSTITRTLSDILIEKLASPSK